MTTPDGTERSNQDSVKTALARLAAAEAIVRRTRAAVELARTRAVAPLREDPTELG